MVETVAVARGVLVVMWLVTFGLTLGLTLINFQAYRKKPSAKLQTAFIGFAFISMGVAVSNVIPQLGAGGDPSSLASIFLQISETIPLLSGSLCCTSPCTGSGIGPRPTD